MRFKLLVAISLAALAVGTVRVGAQQSASATLSGRVVDPNGAIIIGAQVAVTAKATSTKRETKTNEEGLFVITNLGPGEYELSVQQAVFKTAVYSEIILQVGQGESMNITLEVGQTNTTITVDGSNSGPLVAASSSVVDRVVSRLEIERLPLNGRNFLELALLAPGNSPAPNFDPTKTNTVLISSAGQLGRGGNVTIDGADNNDDVVGGSLENISQDAVQEFQIATNRFSAQLGRSGSSVINIVTKSGSNSLHGSGSFFFRNKTLQGLPATFDRGLGETPPFDRQQYAFSVGGPIRKDRAWFFGSVEYRNQDGAALVGSRDLATRTIRRTFAAAPLNDLLSTERLDWQNNAKEQFFFFFSLQRASAGG